MSTNNANKDNFINEMTNFDEKTDDCNIDMVHNFLRINTDIDASDTPKGLSPREIYDFYNYPKGYRGRGRTIALIDAYDYPEAERDLRKFSKEFGLPVPRFDVVYPQGRPERISTSWSLEAALDVQWAHAMAPEARIMLVLASNSSAVNLYDAVDCAVRRGADIISMSWGGRETSGILRNERYFRDKRVIFVAAAGDVGGMTVYPSSSQYVISVGGTRINRNMIGNLVSESAWSGSGGGPSRYIPMSVWQRRFGLDRLAGEYRATPDVAFDADPYSGVSVYLTDPITKTSKWNVVGGTSLAAPSWAGIIASIFRGYRITSQVSDRLYDLAGRTGYTNLKECFHDITTGSAGSYKATDGYDFITGLGSPDIENILRAVRRTRAYYEDKD